MHHYPIGFAVLISILVACQSHTKNEATLSHATPVTITHIQIGTMNEVTDLYATSEFRVKTFVKSPVNGYLQAVNASPETNVRKGSCLFIIQTKEAATLGKAASRADTTFHIKGLIYVKAPCNGFITTMNYQKGDYIQEGETLASVSDLNSLDFILELPYSLKSSLTFNKTVQLILPDGQKIRGTLSAAVPTVDLVSQTQHYRINVTSTKNIPENLIAKVPFILKTKARAISLPKEAVLTNENQSECWIMKMIDKKTAVKLNIVKGIESNGRVEIISPNLSQTDQILLTGNYGLPDTASVTIETATK